MPFSPEGAREVFRGRTFTLVTKDVRLPNGRESTFNIVCHPGAVAIVPLFENGDVILLRQYRVAVGGPLYEIPAGTLEPGEPPAKTARRELTEEAGVRCRSLKKIAKFYTAPGFCTEVMHLFVARGLTPAYADGDADEVIEPIRMPYAQALRMIRQGKIHDGKTILSLLMAHEQR